MKCDSTGEILATKRIYTRKNPNPNPPEVVEDPNNILRRSSNKIDKGTFHLQRSPSLPGKGIKSIDDNIFDEKFEKTVFTSKSSSYLSRVIFDRERLISFTTRSSSKFSKKHWEIFWRTLSFDFKKDLLNTESLKELDPLDFFIFDFVHQPSQSPSGLAFSQTQTTKGVHIPVTYSPTFVVPTPFVHIPYLFVSSILTHPMIVPNPPRIMVTMFAHLIFHAQLHDLPQGYFQIIKNFGAEGDITTQQHLDRFNDFVDFEEFDHEDAKMRLFA